MFRSTGYHVPAAAPHPSSPSPTSPPPSPLRSSLLDFPLAPSSPPQLPVPHRIHPCHTRSCRPLRLLPITAATVAATATLAPSRCAYLPSWSPLPLQRGCGACSRACERAWCARAYVRALVCVSSCGSVCAVFRVLADPLPSRRALLLVCPPAVSAANARAALLLLWAVSHIPGGRAPPRDPSDAIVV